MKPLLTEATVDEQISAFRCVLNDLRNPDNKVTGICCMLEYHGVETLNCESAEPNELKTLCGQLSIPLPSRASTHMYWWDGEARKERAEFIQTILTKLSQKR